MKFDAQEFINLFLEEVVEYIEQLDILLIEFEKDIKNSQTLKKIYRLIHTIKGISSVVGFDDIAEYMHVVEDLLDRMIKGEIAIKKAVINELYHANDILKKIVEDLRKSRKYTQDFKKEIQRFRSTMPIEIDGREKTEQKQGSEYSFDLRKNAEKIGVALQQNIKIYQLTVKIEKREELKTARRRILFRLLGSYGDIIDYFPKRKDDYQTKEDLYLQILFCGDINKQLLSEIEKIDRINEFRYVELSQREVKSIQKEESLISEIKTITDKNTIKVNKEKLDKILNYTQELTTANLTLQNIVDIINGEGYNDNLLLGLNSTTDNISKTTQNLHQEVIRSRMVPIGTLFNRFHRSVRDISHSFGKKVLLKISGQEEEIDKNTIEMLFEPLLHMVRNAIDHGIETPAERKASNKKEEAILELKSYSRENHLFIQVEDDGRGISLNRIREKALAKGIIDEGVDLSDENVVNLIFHPYFSTKEKVDELAGRGIGMNIVKEAIKKLNGDIQVYSKEGKGTQFIITLPPTLSIISALIINVAEQKYAIPFGSIAEILIVEPEQIKTATNQKVLMLRGNIVPLLAFQDYFGIKGNHRDNKRQTILVINNDGKVFGLMVDEVLKKQEIVTKPLTDSMIRVPGISGSTILGDGLVALIVDVSTIAKEFLR